MCALLSLCLSLIALGEQAPKVIDLCQYRSTAEARTNWTPFDGGLPVEVQEKGIRLPCNVIGNHARAYWDRVLDMDLSGVDRISFSFYVADSSKLSPTFNFYFQSERGWYSASFGAERGWNRVTLSKAQFGTEDTPTGWKHITGLRIGAWKSVDAETTLAIADIKAISSDIVVILGDRTPTTSPEYPTVVGQAKVVSRVLSELGVESGGLSDKDVEDGALIGRRIAVFPHNPNMTEKEMDQVEKFVQAGGRVIGFYSVHPRLLRTIGVELIGWKSQEHPGQFASIKFGKSLIPELPNSVFQASWNSNIMRPGRATAQVIGEWYDSKGNATGVPAMIASDTGAYMAHVLLADDPAGKKQMMLALIGHFDRDVWRTACQRAKTSAGIVGEYTTVAAASAKLGKAATEARRLYAGGLTAQSHDRFGEAIDLFRRSNEAFVAAYCRAQSSKSKEMRAVWCHTAFGVAGLTWDQTTQQLANNGFNMVFPNMLWGGLAYYNSKLLPVDESVGKRGDQIKACIEAAKKHGIEVHVWKVNWNLANAPADFLARMRSEHRTQMTPTGKDIDWLCPSNPANFELERDSMLEVVRNYAVDGIHFDYIRYPDSDGCYCEGCRTRFEEQVQVHIANWPKDVISGELRAKFLDFRRANVTKLVRAVSTEARRIRPGIKLSAAVFSDWPQCRDTVGQDWVNWVKNGYLDFVCPMDYTESATQYAQWMTIQSEAIGKVALFCPGVGVTLDNTMSPDQVVRQIQLGQKAGSSGFILFNLDDTLLKTVLPFLHLGITKEPALLNPHAGSPR